MKLGTYTTFDCPTKKEGEAYVWLQVEFEKIEGIVRRVTNPHDLGAYPSFEVDYPEKFEYVDVDNGFEDPDDQKLVEEKDKWHDKANAITTVYLEKFGKYL